VHKSKDEQIHGSQP